MAAHSIVHFEPIDQRTFSLVVPDDHPLAKKRTVGLEDLVRYPLITFSQDNPFRRYIERVFDQAGLLSQMQVAIEVDSVETADNCVQIGLGVGLVLPPRRNIPPPAVRYRSLARHFGRMPLYLVWEKGAHLLPHVAAFVELAKTLSVSGERPTRAADRDA